MPSSWGRWGAHAAVGDHRRLLVGRLEGPLHPAVEHRLVPRRQLLRRNGPRRCGASGVAAPCVVDGERLVVGAPHRDRRVVAEQVDRLAGLAHGLLADRAGVRPTAAGSPATPACRARRRRRRRSGGRCGRGPGRRSRPGLAGELHVAADTRRRRHLGEGRRVGARLAPFTNSRSPFTENTQSSQRHLAQAGAHARRRSLRAPSTSDLDGDVGERLVAQRPRPPQAGSLTSTFQSSSLLALRQRR